MSQEADWEPVPQNEGGWEPVPGESSMSEPSKTAYTISEEGMRSFGMRTKLGFAEGPQEKLDILRANGVDATLQDGQLRYFDKKTNTLNTVDEAGTTLEDLADLIGEVPEFVGSALGGAFGFASAVKGGITPGILGAAGGSAQGGAWGRKVKTDIARGFGAEISTKEELSRVAESTATGFAGDPAGRVVGKVLQRVAAPAAKNIVQGFKEAQETLGRHKDALGRPLHITPGQGQTGPIIKAGENIARSSFLGGRSLNSLDAAQEAALDQEVTALAKNISKGNFSKEEYGLIVQDAIEKKGNTFRAVEKRLWSEVDSLQPDKLQVDVSQIRKWAAETLAKTAQARSVAPSIAGKKGSTAAIDILSDAAAFPDRVSFTTAHEWISQLSAKTRGGPNEVLNSREIGQMKDLTRRLNLSVEDAGKTLQGKDLVGAYQTARGFTAKWRETFDNKLVGALVNADPQKVAEITFRPNNIAGLREAKKAMGPAAFEKVKGAWISNLFKPDNELELSGAAIQKRLARFDDPTLREILDKPNQLRDVVTLARTIEIAKANAGGGIGSTAIQLTQPGALMRLAQSGMAIQGAGATIGASTRSTAGTTTAAALILGPIAIGKIMASPGGARWLTEGFKVKEGTKEAARVTSILIGLAYRGDRGETPPDIKIVSEREAQRLKEKSSRVQRHADKLENKKQGIPLTQKQESELNKDFPGASQMSYDQLSEIEGYIR